MDTLSSCFAWIKIIEVPRIDAEIRKWAIGRNQPVLVRGGAIVGHGAAAFCGCVAE
jgi:hypothetical protein